MKDKAQSIGEILDDDDIPFPPPIGQLHTRTGDDPPPPMGGEFPVAMAGVSELETQILKLKVARDEHTAMLQEIGITLAQLLEQRRKALQGKVGDLQRELANLDAELGQVGQSAAKPRRGGWKRPAEKRGSRHGGWNAGQVKPGSQTDRLLSALKNNPAREFSAADLENLTGVARGNINGCLKAAEVRGEVRRRKVGDGGKGSTRWSWIGKKQ